MQVEPCQVSWIDMLSCNDHGPLLNREQLLQLHAYGRKLSIARSL